MHMHICTLHLFTLTRTPTPVQLDSRVSELSRDKSDLESRLEEDQDEIEELLEKQRSHITQTSFLQSQLTEAHTQVEELQEAKQHMEGKVRADRAYTAWGGE